MSTESKDRGRGAMPRPGGDVPQHQHNADRMRRAESWLARANRAASEGEKADDDTDDIGFACERFMFLWISFNAAYGYEVIEDETRASHRKENEKFTKFFYEIVRRDRGGIIRNILWKKYSGPVRVLLRNKYVFKPFWESVREAPGGRGWKQQFEKEKQQANNALANGNVDRVLEIVFRRLYVLRNQIFHGGTTFAEGWGRDQVRDGSRIMAALVPTILDIMRADIATNPDTDAWGKGAYPRINESRE